MTSFDCVGGDEATNCDWQHHLGIFTFLLKCFFDGGGGMDVRPTNVQLLDWKIVLLLRLLYYSIITGKTSFPCRATLPGALSMSTLSLFISCRYSCYYSMTAVKVNVSCRTSFSRVEYLW